MHHDLRADGVTVNRFLRVAPQANVEELLARFDRLPRVGLAIYLKLIDNEGNFGAALRRPFDLDC